MSVQRLAGDWLWQYICATGRLGTKMTMSSKMPQIMDIILSCKSLSVDPKEATTALSVYLKNTSTRQKIEVGGRQNLQFDTSVESGRTQPAIGHSEGRQAGNNIHSGGADPLEGSSSEESQSLLDLQEIPDYSDTEL